jgi:hypothetical protein
MAFRRIAVALVVIGLGAVGCAGSDDSSGDAGGISVEEPIGAPDSETSTSSGTASLDADPSVVKTASLQVDVKRDLLDQAAQSVVDLATSPKVGGFLVSSVIDEQQGYGVGRVVVQVPADHFESTVGELAGVGHITRQELEGRDLTPDFLAARSALRTVRARTARVIGKLDANEDPSIAFRLRQRLGELRRQRHSLEQNATDIDAQTTYSTIAVSLNGLRPPPTPEKPAIERSLRTAKSIAIVIASGAVLAAGVVVPLGLLALVLYMVFASVARRVKPRLEG